MRTTLSLRPSVSLGETFLKERKIGNTVCYVYQPLENGVASLMSDSVTDFAFNEILTVGGYREEAISLSLVCTNLEM